MPVVPLREFGRKPSKSRPKTEKELEAERRLEQALGRLQAALPLGWANSESTFSGSLGRESTSLWFVAEASVQQQASKAILGLAEALAEHFRAVERELSWGKRVQAAVSSAIPALHFLLGLPSTATAQRATHACHVAASQLDIWRGAMVPRLVAPLAALLDSQEVEIVNHSSAALRLLILDKQAGRSKGKNRGFQPLRSLTGHQLFESFTEAHALDRMKRQLTAQGSLEDKAQKAGGSAGRRTALEVLELLMAALRKSEELMKQAAADFEWVSVLGSLMTNLDQGLSVAAIGVSALIAGDALFGAALMRGCPDLSAVLTKQLQLQGPPGDGGPASALRLLAAIAPLANSDTLLDSATISTAVVRTLAGHQPDDSLLLESLTTIGALLQRRESRWAPVLLSFGLSQGLVGLLGWPAPSDRSRELTGDSPPRKSDMDPQARRLCWRVLELLGFSRGLEVKASGRKEGKGLRGEAVLGDLPRLVWSHFHSKVYFYSPGDTGSAEERVEISRALLSFLSSPSSLLSKSTRAIAMQDYTSMTEMRIGILPGDPARYFQGPRSPQADCILEGGLLKAAALALLDPFRISAATGFRVITLVALKLDSVLATVAEADSKLDAELNGPILGDSLRPTSAETPNPCDSENPQSGSFKTESSETSKSDTMEKPKSLKSGRLNIDASDTGRISGKFPKATAQNVGTQNPEPLAESLEKWEGKYTLLIAALQAFCGMFGRWRVSVEPFAPESVRKAGPVAQKPSGAAESSEGVRGGLDWWDAYLKAVPLTEAAYKALCGGLVKQLGGVCGSYGLPPGSRCWAIKALSELGVYGCPSQLGGQVGPALETLEESDVVFRFSDGRSVSAHKAILAARCPALLEMQSKSTAGRGGGCDSTVANGSCTGSTAGNGIRPESTGAAPSDGERNGLKSPSIRTGQEGPEEVSEGPKIVQLSQRVSHKAFSLLLEFVYKGWVALEGPVLAEVKRELVVLARKCRLECLAGLLEGKRPFPGDRPRIYSLGDALVTPMGLDQSDVTLVIDTPSSDQQPNVAGDLGASSMETCSGSPGDVEGRSAHLHAHRVVLCARSEYFGALFRSGMRDSISGIVRVPYTTEKAARTTLLFLYTGQLVRPQKCENVLSSAQSDRVIDQPPSREGVPSGTMVSSRASKQHHTKLTPDRTSAVLAGPGVEVVSQGSFSDPSLVAYVETADLANQWMLDRLQELCLEQVRRYLTPENAMAVLQAAAARSQWDFAEAAVPILAPHYRALIDDEGFRGLPDQLQEAVRIEHVRLQQEG